MMDASIKQQLHTLSIQNKFIELEELALQLVKKEPSNAEWFHFYILALIEQNKFSKELSDAINIAITNFMQDARFYYYGAVCAIKGENNHDKALLYCAYSLSLQSREVACLQLFTRLLCATSKQYVKFIFLPDWKIGHLVLEADLWYRKLQSNFPSDVYYVMVYGEDICNREVLEFFRRKVAIADNCDFMHRVYLMEPQLLLESFVERMPYNSVEKFGRKDWVPEPKEVYDFDALRHGTKTLLELTPKDRAKGATLLKKMGIDPEHDSYVCITARTNDYYTKTFENSVLYENINWSFSSCRNANISTYHAAINFLIEQGVYVIRLGKIVDERFEHESDKFIDYSWDFRGQLDGDFMDLFLLGTCKFLICNLSGIAHVAQVMSVPVLMVNVVSWLPPQTTEDDLYLPKVLRNIVDQSVVSYRQYVQLLVAENASEREIPFIVNSMELEKLGWEFVDNEADELLEATKEMWAKVIDKYSWQETDQCLIDQFRTFLPHSHWITKSKTAASPYFLKKYQQELELT